MSLGLDGDGRLGGAGALAAHGAADAQRALVAPCGELTPEGLARTRDVRSSAMVTLKKIVGFALLTGLGWLLFRKRPRWAIVGGTALACAGVAVYLTRVSGIGASSFLDLSMIYVLAAGVVAGATGGVIGALLTRGMKR